MSGFMPHGTCFLWQPGVLTLHVVSDTLIALAYTCIPLLALRFVRRRRALWPLSWCFGTFIVACGVTHAADIWTIWHADYWLAGWLKALCALASVGTAVAMLPLMPYARALAAVCNLDTVNADLRAQYRRIVDTTTDGVLLLDAQARATLVNDRVAQMLGYTAGEIDGRSLRDFIDATAAGSAPFALEREATAGAAEHEYCLRCKDGSALWVELRLDAVYDASGHVAGALALVTDASERHAARSALEASERRYRSLTEAMPQMVWTADAAGVVCYSNRSWQTYTGRTFAQSAQSVWPAVIHAHDLARFLEAWSVSLSSGTLHETEYRMLRASDGQYRWHIGRVTPIRDASGSIEQWVGSCTDIHDYKVASETREILDTIGHIVLIRTEDGSAIYASPHWARYTGANAESMLGYRWKDFVHPQDRAVVDARMAQGREFELDSLQYEVRLRGHDGEYRWFLARTARLPGARGSQPRWLATLTDIEELKRTQSALARDIEESKTAEAMLGALHDAALAATDAKSRFLATMSHEIRTPMNGIVGMAELLLLTKLDEEGRECARVIRESSRSLLRVVNDILDYSKVEAGKLELEAIAFDLQQQLASVLSLLGPQFDAKGLTLELAIDAALPAHVTGDPGRLRQVLLNLIGNALKFTPAGGRVIVRADRAPGGIDRTIPIWFSVEDSGIGIEPDVIERLFVPFSQADESTTRKFGGTGLGLSICAQLVALMGGTIGVHSKPAAGSCFWFLAPFHEAAAAVALEAPRPATPIASLGRCAPQRHERLLIVEDNPINALVARKQFAQLGFTVSEARDGRAAVDAVVRERFDLIFMDCHMPGMDGFAATAAIRDLERGGHSESGGVPIVAMTADVRSEDHERCLTAGMNDFISKPASLEELETTIERWLGGASAREARFAGRRRVAG